MGENKFKSKQKKKPKMDEREIDSDDLELSDNDANLSIEQKQTIAAKADEDEAVISKEVGKLLAHLKKEHGLENPDICKDSENLKKKKKNTKKIKDKIESEESIRETEIENVKPIKQKKENGENKVTKINEKKNEKRPADSTDEANVAKKPKTESPGDSKNALKKEKLKKEVKKESEDGEEKDETITNEEESEPCEKKEHPLKNSFPVFVGNLPLNVKQKRISHLFSKCGKILSVRLRSNTGKPFFKGKQKEKFPFLTAYVYFSKKESAEASRNLTGQMIGQNKIYVDIDPNKENPREIQPKRTVVVGNLSYQCTSVTLHDAFKCCGDIDYIRVPQCNKGCNGVAFVCFKKPESVLLALKLNDTDINGRTIRVHQYSLKKSGSSIKSVPKNKLNEKGQKKGIAEKPKNGKKKPFLGTKTTAIKKKKEDKKKKLKQRTSVARKLAKKIAPK